MRKYTLAIVPLATLVLAPEVASQDPAIGVSDTEIRIGNILYRSAGRVRDADAERVLDLIQSRSAAIMCVTFGAPSR
jgi:hypothetical protein